MRKTLSTVVVGLLLLVAGFAASPVKPTAEDDFQLVKVADGVFAAIAKPGGLASGNAGFVVGDGGVLIVDTFSTPIALEELLSEIGKQTSQPVRYAVNTHYHLDHSGGNQVLAARGVPIIAHDNVARWQTTKNRRFLPSSEDLEKRRADAAKQLSETPEDQKDKRAQLDRQVRRFDALMQIKLTNPSITFSSGTTHLYLGTRDVMFTGDMGWAKTLPNLVDATVNDWIPSLDKILANHSSAKFVPGHGSVATAAEIRDFRDYLDDLRNRVKKGIANGLTIEQSKDQLKLPDKYKNFAFQNFAQPNVEDMYKELKGTKQTN